MRKLLFLFISLLPFVGNADKPDILLAKDDTLSKENHRNEADRTTFSAELLSNGSVKVLSSEIATFTVKICNASTGFLLYQGSTINGTLHIAMHSQSTGRYILYIETEEAQYSGVFEI